MPATDELLDLAYRVRTHTLSFKDVPEDKRKDVAQVMARLSDARLQQMGESRRFPRGGGFGVASGSRVN